MQTKTNVYIRWMIRRDMAKVLEIETKSFEFPWSEQDFIRCLRQRNCIGMVCEMGDESIGGFMVYELHKNKLVLLDLAVHPGHRHEGVGSQMIYRLTLKLSVNRRNRIVASVSERNLEAQLFFKVMGFRSVGIDRRPYDNDDCDAYRMVYRLRPSTESDQRPVSEK